MYITLQFTQQFEDSVLVKTIKWNIFFFLLEIIDLILSLFFFSFICISWRLITML